MRPALLAILVLTLAGCHGGNKDGAFQLGKSTTDPVLASPPAYLFERAR